MKRLQEETMCKMAVLGRGSMRDRQKVNKKPVLFSLKHMSHYALQTQIGFGLRTASYCLANQIRSEPI